MITPPKTSLPDRVMAWIRSEGGEKALLLITVDGWLRPHVMMLARDEVFVATPTIVRVAVGEESRSAENLRQRASATIAIYDADLACVVKTRVGLGPRSVVHGVIAFDLSVEDLRLDAPTAEEASTRLISGLRFEGRTSREDIRDTLAQLDNHEAG